jgi:hypothetical protein
MGKKFVIGTFISLLVFIAGLAASTYGLGIEKDNKEGVGYQTASVFTMIGVSGTIIGLILLIISVLGLCGVTDVASNAMSYTPLA